MTTPRRPADAYYEVANILGPDWFTQPAAEQGMELVIEGIDRVHTTWHVPFEDSIALKVLVHNHSQLRLVSERPFTSFKPTRGNP